MAIDQFNENMRVLHARVIELQRKVASASTSEPGVISAALDELAQTLDSLQAAEGQLKEQHEELLAARQTLEIEQRRYQDLFQFAPDAYLVTDRLGVILEANRAAGSLFNVPTELLIGKPLRFFLLSEDRLTFKDALRGDDVPLECNLRLVPRDKLPFEAALTSAAVRDIDGRIIGKRWLVRDISERKHAEEEIRHLNSDLESRVRERTAQFEAASQAKDRFLAVLSHELRTPLTPVLALVSALQADPGLPYEIRSAIGMIRRNVELEARLIDDLLDLTRIRQGKLQLNLEVVDVRQVVTSTLEICQGEIEDKRLHVVCELDADRQNVRADPARMQQVLWNLIKNSVKFTAVGGRIIVRTANPSPSLLRLQVIDDGIGIETHLMSRLFQAFEQGEQPVHGSKAGLGLGLSIARALIEAHGGRIQASSEGRARGATMTIELPAVDALSVSRTPAHTDAVRSPSSKPVRVLLVEDHADTARVLASILKRWGHRVDVALTKSAALECANVKDFDLMISDIGLPDGSGLDLMRLLSADKPLKAIALSGFGMHEDIEHSRQAGFMAHITKPVNLQSLRATVERVLAAEPLPAEREGS